MPNNSVSGDHLPEPSALALSHSENFEPTIQDTLSTLANIEARYQYEREQLECRSGPEGVNTRCQQELEERHRKEREPLVHQHPPSRTNSRRTRMARRPSRP